MTFRITTFASPLQIAAFHAGGRASAKKSKPFKRGPRLIEMLTRWDTDGSWIEIDLPISVQAQHGYMRAHKVIEAKTKEGHLMLLNAQLKRLWSVDRDRISEVTFTRFSKAANTKKKMDSDNLGWSVKHLRDGTALWIVTGETECPRHEWGSHDGIIEEQTGRDIWVYKNATHETDKRLQGIRIRLHLAAR